MKRWLRLLLPIPYLALGAFIAALFVVAQEPEHPGEGAFDPIAFFDGASVSEGTITTFAIRTRAFTAGFEGTADGSALRLDERFRFPDGEPLQRWDLRRDGDVLTGSVETQLEDGSFAPPAAISGEISADGVTIRYAGQAPGGSDMRFDFRHLMRANEDGTVSNFVTVSKFGIPIAVSRVTFSKPGP